MFNKNGADDPKDITTCSLSGRIRSFMSLHFHKTLDKRIKTDAVWSIKVKF